MNALADMLWVELRKALRSRVPPVAGLMSLLMPLGIGLLVFAARNPEISRQMGLISAKANLLAYSATDWPAYLRLAAMMSAAGGFGVFVFAITWTFGREFVDGTLKDMLAVPVSRAAILLAKFAVVGAWSAVMSLILLLVTLLMGSLIRLPGGSPAAILQGSRLMLLTSALAMMVVTPFAFFASVGRGYLLPIGVAMLALIAANLLALAGWGEYFPWAVPGLVAQGTGLTPASYVIVAFTALAGMLATYAWWMRADQNR